MKQARDVLRRQAKELNLKYSFITGKKSSKDATERLNKRDGPKHRTAGKQEAVLTYNGRHQSGKKKGHEKMRLIAGLRSNLMEKLRYYNVKPPSICSCTKSFWETHPDTCYVGCVFHENHDVYINVLQELLED